ncbi:hypothetical protein SERLA73DRAFT_187997 [Serpula lacrymans var. lacrymans S7.3]|uniref:Uncharacterized protein n=2 Tax=Serpula lacrymans var. lacrymans TaxID=341189 RepID=F8Q9Z4_SERL3|nr:uncharacterized protein SERLADRAFT_477936 [Serpula lacrymans var. lacrymans S7.9]EGN94899.1 hypothetical protein SERLA73DRAFT_187997 [Serpula lacrymans var. lacrymans S7.3]EGO20399.1 hypothetical protein SERLADRAFT_477936 [Serpula lacrymans var. lacrymans S7.9]
MYQGRRNVKTPMYLLNRFYGFSFMFGCHLACLQSVSKFRTGCVEISHSIASRPPFNIPLWYVRPRQGPRVGFQQSRVQDQVSEQQRMTDTPKK